MTSLRLSDAKFFSQLVDRYVSVDSKSIDETNNQNDISLNGLLTELGNNDRNLLQSFVSNELKVHCDDSSRSDVEEFKKQYLNEMPIQKLVESVYTRPQISLEKSKWTDKLTIKSISYQIAWELFLIQDFITVTQKSIVISYQRDFPYASSVISFALEFSKEISGRSLTILKSPTRLCGSDFISLGNNISLLGIGPSSNMEAANYLMKNSIFGTQFVAIIKDCYDWDSSRLHLQDILEFKNDKKVKILDLISGNESIYRRLVDLYHKSNDSDSYKLIGNSIELSSFLSDFLQLEVQLEKSVSANNQSSILSHLFPTSSYNGSSLSEKFLGISKHRFSTNLEFSPVTNIIFDHSKLLSMKSPWPKVDKNSLQQTTDVVLMVTPTNFTFNYETAQDNSFMNAVNISAVELRKNVLREFSELCKEINKKGIEIHVILNDTIGTADAVFPNNWFSTQNLSSSDPTLVLYTMKSEARRKERNTEIIERLKQNYTKIIDLTSYENEKNGGKILEGTGALVLDNVNKIAYVCVSQRADKELSEIWANQFGYQLVSFRAVDKGNNPIYHTNVVMSVGTNVAILCEECIPDETERKLVKETLEKHHTIVTITYEQMNSFAGNVLELKGKNGLCALMSKTAYNSFTPNQKQIFSDNKVEMVYSDINYLETIGGGSVRCCIAQLF